MVVLQVQFGLCREEATVRIRLMEADQDQVEEAEGGARSEVKILKWGAQAEEVNIKP